MAGVLGRLKGLLGSEVENAQALDHILSIVQQRPLDLNVETTNFCPLRCVFCPNQKKRRTKAVMERELFRKICDDYYKLGGGAIGICSMQSDIFSDDLLQERLAELARYRDRFRVYTTTNLVGASKLDDAGLELLLTTLDHLEISIGGLTRDEYREMYGIDAFDLVVEQLFRVAEMVASRGIEINLDLSIRTNHLLRLRVMQLFGDELLSRLKKSYHIFNSRSHFFSWGGLITQADLPKGARIRTVDNRSKRLDCVIPWTTLSVNTDGRVIGCGCIDWEARHVVGDLKVQNIAEIWNSAEAKGFRTSFSRGAVPPLCADCSHYCSRDLSFSSNALLDYQVTDGLYYKQ